MIKLDKRTIIIAAAAIVVVAVVLFLALKPKPPQTSTVASDDGAASLEMPADALPEGVKPEDISIKLTEDKQAEGDDGIAVITYELAPDGLKLSKPASFSVKVKNPALTVPNVFVSSKDGLEPVSNRTTYIDAATGDTTESFDLSHFSSVTVQVSHSNTKAMFSVSGTAADTPVGQQVPSQATIQVNEGTKYDQTHVYPDMTFTWTYSLEPDSAVLNFWSQYPDWGHLKIGKPSSGAPQEVKFSGSALTVPRDTDERYVCEKVGPTHLDISMVVGWKEKVTNEDGREVEDIFAVGKQFDTIVVHTEFECTTTEAKTWQAFAVALTGGFQHFSGFSEVNGTVSVVANDPVPVPDATVTLKMQPQYGKPETTEVVTGADGKADFKFKIYSYGNYTVSVEDIKGKNIEYHPELNEVSSVDVNVH